jgi:hypothetical protein
VMAAVEPGGTTTTTTKPPATTTTTPKAPTTTAPGTSSGAPAPVSTPTSTPLPTTATDDQIKAYAASAYGYLSAFLNDPEIGPILLKAAKAGWDKYRLEGALTATAWWKRTTQTAREWDALSRLDPATAAAKMAATARSIGTQAQQLGLSIDAKTLNGIALNVNRLGWTDQQVRESLAAHIQLGTKPGGASATMDSLRALASDYAVNLAPGTMLDWTRQIVAGTKTTDGFRSYLVAQAKSLFPSIAAAIDAGDTVKQYFDPYVQEAVQTLGINPDDVNLADPKWRRALVQNDPAKPGLRVPMSLDAWSTELKTNTLYGYDQTTNGRASGAQFVTALAKSVGQQ